MSHDERRGSYGRREMKDRRQNSSSMISAYANHSGPERRNSMERRDNSDRRAATA